MNDNDKKTISQTEINLQHSGSNNLNMLAKQSRKDIFGNIISKKTKKHRVSFSDQVENARTFVEINVVNSYRLINKSNGNENGIFSIKLIY